ncbi:MAG TPA: 3-deoxy-manno-octulosonate cytidylyltransferase, partial [Vicinamibacterales bacterium]|nr:3-deoxy-manno-octulosonate cytidylyltransferase [Vicinamibacterales bacterium]
VLLFVVPPASTLRLSSTGSALHSIAVIPARYASTRFPGKPLADIDGHPMIEHVYRRAAASPAVRSVLVATDDERIQRAVEAFGGDARLTRPTHRSGTERLAEIAAGLACDVVVNVQGDEPLLAPGMIDEVVAPLAADPDLLMTTLRRPMSDAADLASPHVVKVVVDRNDFALYFSRAPIPYGAAAGPVPASKHIGIYAYRRTFLLTLAGLPPTPLEQTESLEQLRALEHGYRIKAPATIHDSIGVDTPEDLERVRRAVAAGAHP